MTSLWCNFSGNVVANSNWSCLLIAAPKVHWRVQSTAARQSGRFNKMLCAQCTCLNSASTRTARKWLKRNNGHLITLHIWMPWKYHVWGTTHEAILKPSSETQISFWIKSRTEEDMGQFSAGPINKAVPSFTSNSTKERERWRKIHWAFVSLPKHVFTLTVFALLWIVKQFLTTS